MARLLEVASLVTSATTLALVVLFALVRAASPRTERRQVAALMFLLSLLRTESWLRDADKWTFRGWFSLLLGVAC